VLRPFCTEQVAHFLRKAGRTLGTFALSTWPKGVEKGDYHVAGKITAGEKEKRHSCALSGQKVGGKAVVEILKKKEEGGWQDARLRGISGTVSPQP